MPRPKTLNRGAADEREAIKDHLKRMQRRYDKARPQIPKDLPRLADHLVDSLLDWIAKRAERSSAQKGGLGKK
jgi:hypothetical protein